MVVGKHISDARAGGQLVPSRPRSRLMNACSGTGASQKIHSCHLHVSRRDSLHVNSLSVARYAAFIAMKAVTS